jgi:predicted metal-dependent hydrolase
MPPEQLSMQCEGTLVPFQLTRRRNQRYINIRISHQGEVLVSAPHATSIGRIKEALHTKQAWITKHLGKARSNLRRFDPLFAVPLHGERYEIRVEEGPAVRDKLKISPREKTITIETSDNSRKHLIEILQHRIPREARNYLRALSREISEKTGIRFEKLFVRNQKTRWGSSSGRGNISLNWRVFLLPPDIQRYLVIHELVHQRHMNHSLAFWKHVEKFYPDYKKSNRWLREHSYLLAFLR